MNTLATINPNGVSLSDALAAYAASVDGAIPGRRLKFVKGDWFIDDNLVVDLNDEYRAEISCITKSWEKWQDKQLVDTIIATLREPLPQRLSLGDFDKTQWELGRDGQLRDPWQEKHYLGLIRLRDNEQIAYATSSKGGKKAIGMLARADRRKIDAGMLPIVTLGCGSYPHKDFGKIPTPCFKIVRWVREDDGDAQTIDNGTQLIEVPADFEPGFAGYDPADALP